MLLIDWIHCTIESLSYNKNILVWSSYANNRIIICLFTQHYGENHIAKLFQLLAFLLQINMYQRMYDKTFKFHPDLIQNLQNFNSFPELLLSIISWDKNIALIMLKHSQTYCITTFYKYGGTKLKHICMLIMYTWTITDTSFCQNLYLGFEQKLHLCVCRKKMQKM